MIDKEQYFATVRSNIEKYEYHVTVVGSETTPRYAYTIGLSDLFGFELILAGGIIYLYDDLFIIFFAIVAELKKDKITTDRKISLGTLGTFSLSATDISWNKLMTLGVFKHYNSDSISAFQIIPDADHYTLDIPNMADTFNSSSEPVWQWLVREWDHDYAVPKNSTVITNIDALLGETITEITSWEHDNWEMFAGEGPDVAKKDTRVVPLATILGIDDSILPAINLEIGKGLLRDTAVDDWSDWG